MRRPGKIVKWILVLLTGIIAMGVIATFFIMKQPQFGKAPSGARLEALKRSPNFRNGRFQNITHTTTMSKGYTMVGEIYRWLFKTYPRTRPAGSIPSEKTNLKTLPPDSNILVWFGHSSYFMQLNGVRILVDPVFSGTASPAFASIKAFAGTDIYTADDMPPIDHLLITHDHYDHLDHQTIVALKPKVRNVICGLGVGEHFEYWGYEPSKIIEKDWHEVVSVSDDFTIHTAPARHGSGRKLAKDNTLWLSFIIDAPGQRIYVGGDSGYDIHFSEIGKKFGSFDLAILDNGQYDLAWREIHLLPEEVIQATQHLQASRLFPVHASKFKLGHHPWDEPLVRVAELSVSAGIPLVTPMIGQAVYLDNQQQTFDRWWENIH
jgi:L-ascorbate metabolism protein UlaG (beta-lactamase superfamily)